MQKRNVAMRIIQYIVNSFFLEIFGSPSFCRNGEIRLTYGKTQMFVEAFLPQARPSKVWLAITDVEGVPVCQGSINMAGAEIAEGGFNLYADIQTDSATVRWFVSF
jgi:hypothetical protein